MAKKEEVKAPTSTRKYKETLEFDHDLFRLENSTMTRNIAWSKGMQPIWEPIDHKHFFHTFDSDGRQQTRSTSIAGHFHPVKVTTVDGKPSIEVGVASKEMMVRDEETGVLTKRVVELKGREAHTHKGTYIVSELLKARKVNEEAVKTQSHFLAKETPPLSAEERKTIRETSRDKAE